MKGLAKSTVVAAGTTVTITLELGDAFEFANTLQLLIRHGAIRIPNLETRQVFQRTVETIRTAATSRAAEVGR